MNHKLPLCLTSPRSKCTEHRCSEYLMGGSGRLCILSCSSHSKCHSKLNTYRCKIIVVAPGWPRMHWFLDLVNLSTKPPLQLSHWPHLLKQPFSHEHSPSPPKTNNRKIGLLKFITSKILCNIITRLHMLIINPYMFVISQKNYIY